MKRNTAVIGAALVLAGVMSWEVWRTEDSVPQQSERPQSVTPQGQEVVRPVVAASRRDAPSARRSRTASTPDTIAVRWWRAEDEPHAMWVQWADGGRCEWEMGAGEREGVVRCARPDDTNNHTVELPHVGALTRLEVGP